MTRALAESGRTPDLVPKEVARELRTSVQAVYALLAEYRDSGGTRGLEGYDISTGSRPTWRVTRDALDRFKRQLGASDG